MRSGEPKTQREILASLGDLPHSDRRWSLLDTWKSKTLENRHVALACIVIIFLVVAHRMLSSPAAPKPHATDASPAGGHHVSVHFSRDRPLSVFVVREVPPVEGDVAAWEALINQWDTMYPMVLVLSSTIEETVLRRLDAFLKKQGVMVGHDVDAKSRASWFITSQTLIKSPFLPTTPRLSVSIGGFQSIVFGRQVEIMTTASVDDAAFRNRMQEGQGEVSTRLLLLPDWGGVRLKPADERKVVPVSPVTCVSLSQAANSYRVVRYDTSGLLSQSTDELPTQKHCIIRPFEVSNWVWTCTPPPPPMRSRQ